MTEFNLSEKMFDWKGFSKTKLLMREDVKEFIRRLKEDIMLAISYGFNLREDIDLVIDKLAGEELR